MKRTSVWAAVTLAVCVGIWLPGSTPASACGAPMRESSKDEELLVVARAAELLERGELDVVASSLRRFTGYFASAEETANQLAVRKRGERMLARAVAESGGHSSGAQATLEGMGYMTASARVDWAVRRLQALVLEQPDDPQVVTDLAVAMSKTRDRSVSASIMLESLAARDLITSASGWAALVQLRSDPAGKREAHRRCLLMALSPERCGGAPPEEAPAVAVDGSS